MVLIRILQNFRSETGIGPCQSTSVTRISCKYSLSGKRFYAFGVTI